MKYKLVFLIVLFMVIINGLVGCKSETINSSSDLTTAAESENTYSEKINENTFYGVVVEIESDFGGLLVKPESDILPPELVVHSESMPKVSVGDRVRVEHNGQITMSYPGQIFGAKIIAEK